MRYRWTMLGVALLAAGRVWAAAAPTDPGDPKASVAPLAYTSVFERYRGYADAKVGAWKETNDNVGRIGGWRVYLKEAQQPDPPAAAPKPAASRRQHQH